jgi:hypothetical protein
LRLCEALPRQLRPFSWPLWVPSSLGLPVRALLPGPPGEPWLPRPEHLPLPLSAYLPLSAHLRPPPRPAASERLPPLPPFASAQPPSLLLAVKLHVFSLSRSTLRLSLPRLLPLSSLIPRSRLRQKHLTHFVYNTIIMQGGHGWSAAMNGNARPPRRPPTHSLTDTYNTRAHTSPWYVVCCSMHG